MDSFCRFVGDLETENRVKPQYGIVLRLENTRVQGTIATLDLEGCSKQKLIIL